MWGTLQPPRVGATLHPLRKVKILSWPRFTPTPGTVGTSNTSRYLRAYYIPSSFRRFQRGEVGIIKYHRLLSDLPQPECPAQWTNECPLPHKGREPSARFRPVVGCLFCLFWGACFVLTRICTNFVAQFIILASQNLKEMLRYRNQNCTENNYNSTMRTAAKSHF